jgi:hypothetical protein
MQREKMVRKILRASAQWAAVSVAACAALCRCSRPPRHRLLLASQVPRTRPRPTLLSSFYDLFLKGNDGREARYLATGPSPGSFYTPLYSLSLPRPPSHEAAPAPSQIRPERSPCRCSRRTNEQQAMPRCLTPSRLYSALRKELQGIMQSSLPAPARLLRINTLLRCCPSQNVAH